MHRKGTTALLTVAFVACSAADDTPAPDSATARGQTSVSVTADGSGAKQQEPAQEIYIDSVTPGNPLIVTGRARTFENTVQVRARDARGAIITEVFETSVGEMGNHNPFTARVWLVRDPGPHVIVESFEYSANDGSVRSLTTKHVPMSGTRMPASLRFSTSDCGRTAEFTRQVPRAVATARLLVEMLVAGPTEAEKAAGASAPFPPGSRVNAVTLRGGELTVDFNERLQNVGGACAAQAIRESVTRTLMRLPAVKSVVITAGGSREQALQP